MRVSNPALSLSRVLSLPCIWPRLNASMQGCNGRGRVAAMGGGCSLLLRWLPALVLQILQEHACGGGDGEDAGASQRPCSTRQESMGSGREKAEKRGRFTNLLALLWARGDVGLPDWAVADGALHERPEPGEGEDEEAERRIVGGLRIGRGSSGGSSSSGCGVRG